MGKQYSAIFCNLHSEPAIVDQVYQTRKKIFVDHYGWDIPHSNGREHDAFDTAFTVYCALFRQESIVATFRAIRTDNPYLSAWVFPQLATEHPYPRRRDCWEVSRFGVVPRLSNELRLAALNYALMFHFAEQVGARHLVASAELTHERFLRSSGITTRRYGPPQRIGSTKSGAPLVIVAGDIPVHEQQGNRFARLIRTIDHVEITDASYVFGPARISA